MTKALNGRSPLGKLMLHDRFEEECLMMSVSGVSTGAVRPLTAEEKVLGASKLQKPEEAQGRRMEPVMDGFVPEEPREPSGRYWMGRDEDGQPKI